MGDEGEEIWKTFQHFKVQQVIDDSSPILYVFCILLVFLRAFSGIAKQIQYDICSLRKIAVGMGNSSIAKALPVVMCRALQYSILVTCQNMKKR